MENISNGANLSFSGPFPESADQSAHQLPYNRAIQSMSLQVVL